MCKLLDHISFIFVLTILNVSNGQLTCYNNVATGYLSSITTYTFYTPTPQTVTFTNCESDFDTRMYLTSINYTEQYSSNGCDSDDCVDTRYCNNSMRETFSFDTLNTGTYNLYILPYSDGGNYKIEIFCPDITTTFPTQKPSTTHSNDLNIGLTIQKPSTTTHSNDSNTGLIIYIIIGVVVVVVLIVGMVILFLIRKCNKKEPIKVARTHGKPVSPRIQQVKQVPIVAAPKLPYKQQVKQVPVVVASSPAYKYEAVPTTVPLAYAPSAPNIAIECDENDENDKIKQWFHSQVALSEDTDRYFDMFIENGFDNLDIIQLMTEQDLVEMGITKLGHRRKILISISKL